MSRDDFHDSTLVLLGHGSTKNAGSAAPVFQHAAALRRRRLFADVREAFWKQDPKIGEVLKTQSASRVFIVPLFISEGHFSGNVIPQALGFVPPNGRLESGHSTLFYTRPIGTHERMTEVLLARARGIVQQFPFPREPRPVETTLFIAGHGTEQNENSREAIERQAQRIQALGEYAAVRPVFIEEDPRITACYELSATRNIVMVPFFISDGMHTQEDIPVLLGEAKPAVQQRLAAGQPTWRNPTERNGKLVWYAPAIGTAPEISEVILDRVREAATG